MNDLSEQHKSDPRATYFGSGAHVTALGLILLSWGLLVWDLERHNLWVDEFLTLQMIQGTPQDVIAASMADQHPPLYFLAIHAWSAVAGSSDFALRWLSAAAGSLGLALMPGIARRLAGPRAAVPATLLLSIAPAFVEFSRMARYYSFVLALGLLSTKLLWDAICRDGWKRWLAYGLAGLALVYTFYPGGILLVAHGLIVILPGTRGPPARHWLMTLLGIGLVFAPWFGAIVATQITGVSGSGGVDFARSGLGFALGIGASFYTFSVGETIFPWRPEAWIGLAVIAILLGMGLRGSSEHGGRKSAGLFLLSVTLMAVVTNFVSVGTPFLNVPVRSLFALPYYLLIVAAGLTDLASTRGKVVLGGALLAVCSVGIFNYFTGQQFLNPIYLTPAREAADFVRQNVANGDLVISDYDSVFGHYFLTTEDRSTPQHLYTDQIDEIQVALQRSQPLRVWLVIIGRDQSQRISTAEAVRQMLAAGYRLDRTERFLPIDSIYLKAKNFVLRRDSYEYRLTIEIYAHVER